jgi:FkbM family methyltransferase
MSISHLRLLVQHQSSRLLSALSRLDKSRAHSRLSFSQSGEDLIVDYIFQRRGVNSPSYIDIGAFHPWQMNNTALFYKRGSRGVSIEPHPFLFEKISRERSLDINLNIGISDRETEMDFFVIEPAYLSTFLKSNAEKYVHEHSYKIEKVVKIKVDTLNNILKQYFPNACPDFLSLDAEGIDLVILKSIDFARYKPKVICVETMTYSRTGRGQKESEIPRFLESQGYMVYADTHINTILVLKTFWIH